MILLLLLLINLNINGYKGRTSLLKPIGDGSFGILTPRLYIFIYFLAHLPQPSHVQTI